MTGSLHSRTACGYASVQEGLRPRWYLLPNSPCWCTYRHLKDRSLPMGSHPNVPNGHRYKCILREKPVLRLIIYEAVMFTWQFIVNGFNFTLAWGAWGDFLAVTVSIIVITFFYNGKKGHFPTFSKWFFYVFYPAHLLAVIIIRALFL